MRTIKNLTSFEVNYDLNADNRLTLPNTVILQFRDHESADEFYQIFTLPTGERNPNSNHIVVQRSPSLNSKPQIRMYLGFGQTNSGMRINSILDYICATYALPNTITVSCKNPHKELDWIDIPLSSNNIDWLQLDENAFIERVALRDSELQTNLSALIASPVLVQTFQIESKATHLELTCKSELDLMRLKNILNEKGVDKRIDHLFHFKKIPGVAGAEHPGKCLVKIKADLNFHELLSSLEWITRPPVANLTTNFDDDDCSYYFP
ncbi:MAG: hypothetical protein EPN84_00565 [Legionella sp.]|nr:MAG: hypothetical protein EPN84_00565 [Legionella sp.]